MSNEFCAGFENAPIPTINDLNLLEVMDICSNLYLTHLLAVKFWAIEVNHLSNLAKTRG